MASPVFKTAWAAVRSPEGSTPFLLRRLKLKRTSNPWPTDSRNCRPCFLQLLIDNTNRDQLGGGDLCIQPNIDYSPFAQPSARETRAQSADGVDHAMAAGGLSWRSLPHADAATAWRSSRRKGRRPSSSARDDA